MTEADICQMIISLLFAGLFILLLKAIINMVGAWFR